MYNAAASQIGVIEKTGKNDGLEVEKYLKTCKLGKGYAWCAAFVNWSLMQCNAPHINNAWVPSWFDARRTVLKKGVFVKKTPERADLIGIWIAGRIGHIGLVDQWGDTVVVTIEGNTNGAGSAEGDGVYRKRRLRSQIYAVADYIGR